MLEKAMGIYVTERDPARREELSIRERNNFQASCLDIITRAGVNYTERLEGDVWSIVIDSNTYDVIQKLRWRLLELDYEAMLYAPFAGVVTLRINYKETNPSLRNILIDDIRYIMRGYAPDYTSSTHCGKK